MIRQGLTTRARTRYGGNLRRDRLCRLLGQFGRDRRQIARLGFPEQITLLDRQGLIADTETHPAQVRQFEAQGLDLALRSV